tara:strand:+ start:272 stop:529 length:258 start_codon:yes stop_codon:yes gene_type:complete
MKIKIDYQGSTLTATGMFIALIGMLILVGAWAYHLAREIFSENTPAIFQIAVPVLVVGLTLVILGLIRQTILKRQQNPDLEEVEN